MLRGLNHLTLAVSFLERSLTFYQQCLGLRCHARWSTGAYLSCGELWLCLSYDSQAGTRREDYTHYAFSIDEADFNEMVSRLKTAGVTCWKDNRSEGLSFYFLDPDNHQLELHVGSLASRLQACRDKPYQQMVFYAETEAANDDPLSATIV